MILYRGGPRQGKFFTTNPVIARGYGSHIHAFRPKKRLKLFVITHASLKKVFTHVSERTRILLESVFGTTTHLKTQIKAIQGKTPKGVKSVIKGQRVSISSIDFAAHEALYREYLKPRGFDGTYSPTKKSRFHGGSFHHEVYIHSPEKTLSPAKQSIQSLFIEYTKGTRILLKSHRDFVQFLGGGMAIKLYLAGKGIDTAETFDFDFKFAVPRPIRTKKELDEKSVHMFSIMINHMKGFAKFLARPVSLSVRELTGVPVDKVGGPGGEKKVYKVFTFSITGKDLIDASLVLYPGITRSKMINDIWSKRLGMPIERPKYMWLDTMHVLTGSFVKPSMKLRNPLNGDKKEKGLKNAVRAGHLSFLIKKNPLVTMSRKLITDIALRDRKSAYKLARTIFKRLSNQTRRAAAAH
jgi:hypothetical protein